MLENRIWNDRFAPFRKRVKADPPPTYPSCDVKNCLALGLHQAPRSRREEDGKYHFCEEHARQYNAGWNYFEGTSSAEMTIEPRARQPYTQSRSTRESARTRKPKAKDRNLHERLTPASSPRELRALSVLGLGKFATSEQIRHRFQNLVKRLHPDLNGGLSVDPEQLRAILKAWSHLRPHRAKSRT